MKVYYRTFHADSILADGFRDRESVSGSPSLQGVQVFSEIPPEGEQRREGDFVLSLVVPDDVLLPREVLEGSSYHREFIVPAEILNTYGPPTIETCSYADWSRGKILMLAKVLRLEPSDSRCSKADRLEQIVIPLLEQHGMLDASDEGDGSETPLEPPSEECLSKLRRMFSRGLASRIEQWTIGTPWPDSTFRILTRAGVPKHIGRMIDIFATRTLSKKEQKKAVAKITVAVNDFIAAQIERL